MIRIKLIKEGEVYIGAVPTSENASLIGLAFSAGKQKDESENGYLIRLNKGGKENASSYLSLSRVFQDLGGRYFALKISKQSLEIMDHAPKVDTSGWYLSQEDYINSIKEAYGNNADTYAFLLYKKGKYQEALNCQEKAMLLVPSAEISARYVTYLIKNDEKDKAFTYAEKLIAEGNGSDSLKVDFKSLYLSLKKEGDYQTYLTSLEAKGLQSVSDSWKKEMIKIPAPAFSLLNIKGERVTLASLKGKIVVLDYWATWCVPCIASFPGMQQSVNNYKNNPDVVFLFVNTAEVAANREVLIKKLLAEKNFDFNVLLDTKNAKDESIYDIKTAYKVQGIPAKFVIDKQGYIRFKREGSTDDIATITKEIDIMIGLAQNDDNS